MVSRRSNSILNGTCWASVMLLKPLLMSASVSSQTFQSLTNALRLATEHCVDVIATAAEATSQFFDRVSEIKAKTLL